MNEPIEIIINGIRVTGQITHRSGSDIAVEILSPYTGMHTGRHIMNMARPAKPKGFMDEYGDTTAKGLLEGLYHLCQKLEDNREQLLESYRTYLNKVDEIPVEERLDEEEYRRRKADLRQSLKRGEITNNDHGMARKMLEKEYKAYTFRCRKIMSGFFGEMLPEARCERDQIEEWLGRAMESGVTK